MLNVKASSKKIFPYLLIFPALSLVTWILGYSVLSGFITSLYEGGLINIRETFVGFSNYASLTDNPHFLNSLYQTLKFVIATIFLSMVISITFALCIYFSKKLSIYLRFLSLIPFLVSGVAVAITWRFLFSGDIGLFDILLNKMGFTQVWLGEPATALFIVVLATSWYISPFSILMILSGLQGLNPEIIDAAAIDGASQLQMIFSIILPSIAPMIAVSLVWLTSASFNMFDIVLPLTGGGPGRTTEFMVVYLYRLAFKDLNIPLSSAIMVILLGFNLTLSTAYMKIFKV